MTALAWAALALLSTCASAALGDLISEEIRSWLDLLPRAILRIAANLLLDPAQRQTIYQDEWRPELSYILRGAESRPITRLIRGIRYALGILRSARRISRRIHRTPQPDVSNAPVATAPTVLKPPAIHLRGEGFFQFGGHVVPIYDNDGVNPANLTRPASR